MTSGNDAEQWQELKVHLVESLGEAWGQGRSPVVPARNRDRSLRFLRIIRLRSFTVHPTRAEFASWAVGRTGSWFSTKWTRITGRASRG